MVISAVNMLAMLGYTVIWVAVNSVVYAVIHGHSFARASIDARPTDAVGLNPFPLPWELFAFGGLVMLVVATVSWPRERRIDPKPGLRLSFFQTGPGFLATTSFLGAGLMAGSVGTYSRLLTVFDPYLLGPLIAVVAGFVALRRWQLDAPPAARTRKPTVPPSALARVLGVLSFADFLFVAIVGFGGIVVNQLVYLSAHGGALPPSSHRPFTAGTDIWVGSMPVQLPWWLFVVCSGVLLVVSLASWPRANQFGPQLSRRIFFRRTTAPPLVAFGLLFFAMEATIDLFYGSGGAGEAAFRGPALALIVVAVGVVRWVSLPIFERRARRSRSSKMRAKGAVSHG